MCGLWTKPLLICALLLCCTLPYGYAAQSVGTDTTSGKATTGPAEKQTLSSDLVIGRGDLIDINIFGASDFRQEVRVSSAGEVSLPLIGMVQLAGLRPEEAQKVIHDRLVAGNFYKDPQVSVFVKEYGSGGVYVLGEVQKPGFYPLTNVRRVLEAISVAGGTTPKAGKTVTVVNRGRPQSVSITLGADGTNTAEENLELIPGDTVTVSKAGIVYVVGDVRMPTGVIMEHGRLTVLQAIAMAQGTNPTAALDHAKLIRRSSTEPHEVPLSLKKILASKAPDVTLEPEDIVFVPSSASKHIARRSLDAALQAAVGVAIWGRY